MYTQWLQKFLDFAIPTKCHGCHAVVEPSGLLCGECEGEFHLCANRPRCRCCAHPLPAVDSPCPWCLGKGHSPIESIAALAVYSDVVEKLIHHLKYDRLWTIGISLADRLSNNTSAGQILDETDVIVPVPLHPRRQIERGFNPAELVARQIAGKRRIPVVKAVLRSRHSRSQTTVSRTERQHNVKDAFELLDGRKLFGKRVTLIDDVLTTGATISAVARQVKQSAPAAINALVLAVADAHGRDFEFI